MVGTAAIGCPAARPYRAAAAGRPEPNVILSAASSAALRIYALRNESRANSRVKRITDDAEPRTDA